MNQIALSSPLAINATPQQLEYVLAQAMAKAFADMGIKTDDRRDDIAYLVRTMPAEVTRNLPAIRIDEIPIAINRGVMHQFGEFYGLNVATFMRFLQAHYQSEQRLKAVKQHLAATTVPPPPPTPEQQRQARTGRVAAAFEHYKAHGHYNDHGSLVFDIINKMGKIPFGPEREANILERARQNLMNRYSRVPLYPDERAGLRHTLNQLLNGEADNLILIEAKRIALFELFDELIERDENILEWIKKS